MIKYDKEKGRVKHQLETISTWNLEGNFIEVIEKLKEEYKRIADEYILNEKVMPGSNYHYNGYIDGAKRKTVKFDKLFLEWGTDCDDDKVLRVWGERDMLPEEKEAMNQQNKKEAEEREKREKQTYEQLKKKFEETP